MNKTTLVTLVFLLALSGGRTPAQEAKKKTNFVEDYLENLTLGEGVHEEQLVIFPLIAKDQPEPLGVMSDLGATKLRFEEPEWPERRYNVLVRNGEEAPVLVFGGNILMGGELDRMLPRDIIVPAGAAMEIETLPAQYPKERRKEAIPFRTAQIIAPVLLRDRAAFDASRYLVPIFISHFLEFRNTEDERHSLQAIDESAVLSRFCLVCQRAVAEFPDVADSKVVGFITAVRGRIQSIELFESNALLRTYFQPIIRAHTYAAAAVELRAKKLGLPIPGRDDPKATLKETTAAAEELLAELKQKARYRKRSGPRDAIGETLLIRTSRTEGVAVAHDGRLVHAVIFPENPLEEALYSQPLELPGGASGVETSFGDLERRARRGTLTEFEKRLLERMRERRRGPVPGGLNRNN
jgi:hypothetical protein